MRMYEILKTSNDAYFGRVSYTFFKSADKEEAVNKFNKELQFWKEHRPNDVIEYEPILGDDDWVELAEFFVDCGLVDLSFILVDYDAAYHC